MKYFMSSKKKIDEHAVLSELSESRFFQPRESEDTENTPQQSHENELADSPVDRNVDQQADNQADNRVDEVVNQSVSRQARQPVSQSTGRQSGGSFDRSDILGRPKSFYITKKQDRDLDALVQKLGQKLEGKINQKIDRSLAVRLILESNNITDDKTVSVLAGRLVDKLVNQLVD
jgi:hypothetical protein